MNSNEEYTAALEAKKAELKAEMERLNEKAEIAGLESELRYRQFMQELRDQYNDTEKMMEKLRQSSGDAWNEVRSGLDKAFDDMRHSIRQAQDQFK
jgi:hypothetical protein